MLENASYRFDLTGRVALVTGASSGLGERFAEILAFSGARVVLCARRKERLEAAVARIEARGGEALAVPMDASDEASTIAAYDAAEARFGVVDTIIANAGISGHGLLKDLPSSTFDDVMALNLRGPFLTAREGARRMIAAGNAEHERGRVVITSSIVAYEPDSGLGAYGASKAGVVQLGKSMAREWIRSGINVNVICPGYLRTELNDMWFDSEGGQKQIAGLHRRRLMPSDSLDGMVLYLCSDASKAVTGSSFVLDDGQFL